mmetsp:Transcript_51331/g.160277  ORF Transcript_51331/g.160277 Transcript_51331/m.160277 type:complete len:162 (-) Transcript_51331:2154-2639(-)
MMTSERRGSIERTLSISSKSIDALYNEGVKLHKAGQLEEAESCWREGIRRNRKHVPCLVGLGSLLVEEGNKEEGEKLLAEATGVLLCPSFVSVPVGRTHSGGALDGLVTMKDLHPPKPVMRSKFHVGADAVIAVHRMEKEAQRARERRQTEENSFERAKSN